MWSPASNGERQDIRRVPRRQDIRHLGSLTGRHESGQVFRALLGTIEDVEIWRDEASTLSVKIRSGKNSLGHFKQRDHALVVNLITEVMLP